MKLFVFVPLHPVKILWPATKTAIEHLDTSRHEVTVHYESERLITSGMDGYDAITRKYQLGRQLFLNGDYDAMLTIEYDNIVPADTINRLDEVNADVAYGLYCSRNNPRWLAFERIWDTSGITFSSTPELAQSVWNTIHATVGVGLGCTLIRRHVLESIEFRRAKNHPCACDWFLSLDCIAAGYTQAHHFGLHVGHIISATETVWPTEQKPYFWIEKLEIEKPMAMAQYRCLDRLYHVGHDRYYQIGDTIELADESAMQLLSANKIMSMVEEPQIPVVQLQADSVIRRTKGNN